jgi:hypothetical protein
MNSDHSRRNGNKFGFQTLSPGLCGVAPFHLLK